MIALYHCRNGSRTMENYKDFLNRINSFEKETLYLGDDDFQVNSGVLAKVSNNKFANFYGDTVVFNLDNSTKSKLAEITEKLHSFAGECFCEKLKESTFHITLHDLNNSPVLQDISTDISKSEINLKKTLQNNPIKSQTIRMKTSYIFNMVNTSIVLGLYPADNVEYNKLITLYNLVDKIKVLPYPLTPHITLAYYNQNGFSKNSARKLESIVNKLNKEQFEIPLSTKNLVYQKFTSMNNYIDIFSFI